MIGRLPAVFFLPPLSVNKNDEKEKTLSAGIIPAYSEFT